MIERFNVLFIEKGYVTTRAFLPEQDIRDGVLKLSIIKGTIGKIKIEGNRWTKEAHIRSHLDIKEGKIFNIQEFEKNLVVYNRYNQGITIKGDLITHLIKSQI